MARFVPQKISPAASTDFYGTLTRYFYDCPGASCSNFLTGFVLPNRPPSGATISGGIATKNGEISIVELGNVSSSTASAQISIFRENGSTIGTETASVPPLGTKHLIVSRVGEIGYLEGGAVGSAEAQIKSGLVSAVSLFYKLDEFGVLQYGYAAPFVGSPGATQLSEFNSFISHANEIEIYNASLKEKAATLQILNVDQSVLETREIVVAPHGTFRDIIDVPANTYGTIGLSANNAGLTIRNYVSRPGSYVLTYRGQ
jgi:hypothetical protein